VPDLPREFGVDEDQCAGFYRQHRQRWVSFYMFGQISRHEENIVDELMYVDSNFLGHIDEWISQYLSLAQRS
jgi:hypothetical protein